MKCRPRRTLSIGRSGWYVQLARVLFGPKIYEYQKRLGSDGAFAAVLHIGVSASAVGKELLGPIATNLIIGLVAIIVAAIVAIGSANLLLRPLEAISTSIDQLGLPDESGRSRSFSDEWFLV